MWEQVAKTTLSSVISSTSIEIDNTSIFINDLTDYWIIISPFSADCEIRKVITCVASIGIDTLGLTVALSGTHSSGDVVYIQTSPIWDVLLFGARNPDTGGDHASLNTTAFNNAVIDCNKNDGGMVSIPVGRFVLDSLTSVAACIDVSDMKNIEFVGEGIDISTLMINSGVNNKTMFYAEQSENISWRKLTLDGNIANANNNQGVWTDVALTKQLLFEEIKITAFGNNGIHIQNVEIATVRNSIFEYCYNSGLKLSCSDYLSTKSILVENNQFIWNEYEDVLIDVTQSNGDNSIIKDVIITKNSWIRGTPLSSALSAKAANDGTGIVDNLQVTSNYFGATSVYFENCINLNFSNNFLLGDYIESSYQASPFKATKKIERLNIENNIITKSNTVAEAISITSYDDDENNKHFNAKYVNIVGNTIINGDCSFENVFTLGFKSNIIQRNNQEGEQGVIVHIDRDATIYELTDYGNLSIIGNQINNVYTNGIDISTVDDSYKFNTITVDVNTINGSDLDRGILIQPATTTTGTGEYWKKALIAPTNTINLLPTSPDIDIEVVGSYQTVLNPYQECWISNGDPNGLIGAFQGSLSINKTIEADNNYSKNRLEGNTGWELVSEMDKQLIFKTIFTDNLSTLPASLTANPPYPATPTEGDLPQIDVFITSGICPWYFATDGAGTQVGSWRVSTDFEAYADTLFTPSGYSPFDYNAIALVSTTDNGELKGVFRVDTSLIPALTNNSYIGIIFRFLDYANFWRWFFMYDTTSGKYIVRLEEISSGTLGYHHSKIVTLGTSNRFVLKVMMHDSYITVFYNDLLIFSVNDIHYSSGKGYSNHGLVMYEDGTTSPDPIFFCQNFKQLIP